jgi:hypothetical protein
LPRGSKPGERRGGRRKGSRNKATIERELLAHRMLQHAPAGATQNARLGKETLEKFMTLFDDLAEHYRPFPENPRADEGKFTKFATAACECAKALAPYQSPTYRAIVVEQLKSPQRTVLEIRREDLAHALEERGLPTAIFGVDVPVLELKVERDGDGKDYDAE